MADILADDTFICIFLNENDSIPIWISLKFVPRSPVHNKQVLVQVMAWRRTGVDPIHWRIYAALEGDELIQPLLTDHTICFSETECNHVIFSHMSGHQWKTALHFKNKISPTIFTYNSNSMDTTSCYESALNGQIITKFCTCHDSISFCSSHPMTIWGRAKLYKFH